MMRKRDADLAEEAGDDVFGPGTDLVFSILAVLIIMLATLRITALQISGDTDLSFIRQEKDALIAAVRRSCGDPRTDAIPSTGGTTIVDTAQCDLKIVDNPQFQTMIFNESVLFDLKGFVLKDRGVAVLRLVRRAMSERQHDIVEVQILGNTDTVGQEVDNFQLGYQRALAVFELLTQKDAVQHMDPLNTLISLTTYGYYNPTQRGGRAQFSGAALERANADEAVRARNRRIELNIFYRKAEGL